MSQLDKTFPTNDCSSCMIGSKLVELASHRNIKILTKTSVEKLEGEPGNFTLTVTRIRVLCWEASAPAAANARKSADLDLPDALQHGPEQPQGDLPKLSPRRFRPLLPLTTGTSPCKAICPAHISVQGYVALTAQGKSPGALRLIKEETPCPALSATIPARRPACGASLTSLWPSIRSNAFLPIWI